jgi:hypothetical protein
MTRCPRCSEENPARARARIALARALAKVGEKERERQLLRLAAESASEIGATTLLASAEIALSELEPA